MQVREIMTESPACCMPDSSLQEVARLMVEHDCGCIPVVDSRMSMRPVGTITDRDITVRAVAANRNPIDMKAADIMTTDIAAIKPGASIEECFDVMENKEIRRVLVVDANGRCCGIVAQADVVQFGTNPVHITKLVREISESAPSRGDVRSAGWRNVQPSPTKESFISTKSLFPFLIGLSGAAALYYLGSARKTQHDESLNDRTIEQQPTATHFIDAEDEVKRRQRDLSSRVQALKTETRAPVVGTVKSRVEEDDTTTNREIGRTAKPY